jgi:peptidoglycan/LPS O-acetylase OafA/YrhL
LRYIGRISYGIYLLHYPIFILWARSIASENFLQSNLLVRNLLAFVGQILLAIIAATISWRLFEQPILGLKERFPSGSKMHWPATYDATESTRLGHLAAADS